MNLDYPLQIDPDGRTATAGDDDHIRDMLEQLLFCSPGERLNRPDFGAGLRELVHEPNSPELAAALQFTVQAALQRWLGDVVEVAELGVRSEGPVIQVAVHYRVLRTGVERTVVIP